MAEWRWVCWSERTSATLPVGNSENGTSHRELIGRGQEAGEYVCSRDEEEGSVLPVAHLHRGFSPDARAGTSFAHVSLSRPVALGHSSALVHHGGSCGM
jgi:hypothetical protein